MANRKVTLVRICKTEKGWRRYPVAMSSNGKIKPGVVKAGRKEVSFPEGRYELRTYEGTKMVYRSVGQHAGEALAAQKRETHRLTAKESASEAGLQIVEDVDRVSLTKMLARFRQATLDRGSVVAEDNYRLACEEFLQVVRKTYPNQLTHDDMLTFQKALKKRGCSARTIYNRHALVKSFLRFCGLDVKSLAPIAPKYDKTMPEIYSAEELKAFYQSLKTDYHRLTFTLLLQTGLREQEAIHLEWSDISMASKTLTIHSKPQYGFRIKDKEERSLPLSDELIRMLRDYRKVNPKMNLVLGTKTDTVNWKLLRALKRQVKSAGLNCGQCKSCRLSVECENWYLHKFRATYCTALLRAGLDLRTVQQMMGHSDLASTMRYLRPAEGAEIQSKVNSIKWR